VLWVRELPAAFMMVLLLSTLVFTGFFSPVQAATTWTQTFEGGFNDRVDYLIETSDGGFAIAGNHYISGEELADFWLIKTNSSGDIEWNHRYNRTDEHLGIGGLVQASDGGFAIAGKIVDANQSYLISLIRLNETGNLLWEKEVGSGPSDSANALIQASDGGFAIAGKTLGYGGSSDFWLIKTDANGTLEWDHKYGGIYDEEASTLTETSDGGFAIAGNSYSAVDNSSLAYNPMLINTHPNGSILFWQIYGNEDVEITHALVTASDGGYALAGVNATLISLDFDYWLIKTDADGYIEWKNSYEGTVETYVDHVGLVTTPDGGLALAGSKGSWSEKIDTFLLKTDVYGNMQWNQTYTLPDYGMDCGCLVVTSDGGCALAGQTNYNDIFLIKTDESGVVPEASWVILPLLLVATLFIFISKKKLLHPRSQ
jgi:hypothetical protein